VDPQSADRRATRTPACAAKLPTADHNHDVRDLPDFVRLIFAVRCYPYWCYVV